MNSEELEKSLRTEFENYLKSVIAEMRDETVEFQKKIEANFDEQRSRFHSAFQAFSARFDSDHAFNAGFTETVVEHLRLARDEGAQLTANAIAEAEELERALAPTATFADINNAISDISTKDSQSAILKSLVTHAADYTSRGAFFIIKNEHFVGWKVFGKEATTGDDAIREIHFPISSDSILGKAVTSLSTVEGSFGSYSDDSAFLEALDFGQPDRMYAIPLTARGKGVAVLYADYGHEGITLNTDALESLMRVAGMTVELLASAKDPRVAQGPARAADFSQASDEMGTHEPKPAYADTERGTPPAFEPGGSAWTSSVEMFEPAAETPAMGDFAFAESEPAEEYKPAGFEPPETTEPGDFGFAERVRMARDYESADTSVETERFGAFDPPTAEEHGDARSLDDARISDELNSFEPEPALSFEKTERMPAFDPPPFTPAVFEASNPYEAAPFDKAADAARSVEPPAADRNGAGTFALEPVAEAPAPVVEIVAPVSPARSRLSDRNVDLPIDVAEDERRVHNDARRFARLLVSEIKLYNEKKVQEGREARDLYERLREAIDRSREMYDKRVQPPVAAKFDYFHYEVVSALGDGDESRLGPGYPGAKV